MDRERRPERACALIQTFSRLARSRVCLRFYFFLGAALGATAAPPPNGLGGTATPRNAVAAALPCALGFVVFAGGATTTGAGAGSGVGGAITTGAGGGEGAAAGGGAAFASALADADAVFARGSSAVPMMTSAAVPRTTHTPTSTRHTRAPRLIACRGRGITELTSENAMCEGAERMLGASPVYT